jgi:hypothetical protein
MQRLAKRNAAKATRVHELLHYLYPSFDEDLSNYPNIEDFLNLLEMTKAFHDRVFIQSKKWTRVRLQEVMDITLRAITEYIWDFMADKERRGVLADLVRQVVRPGDVIISFNWDFMIDLVLEAAPRPLSVAYTYPPSRKSVVLLKPHGSIDWFEKGKVSSDKKLQSEMKHRATGLYFYPYFDLAENPDLLESLPFIVPPLSVKRYDAFLQRVWRHVYHAVAAATELYFIGYSLPQEDQFARLVMGLAIRRNNSRRRHRQKRLPVTVVNPDEGAGVTFARLVGAPVQFFPTSLQDYVSWLRAQHEAE